MNDILAIIETMEHRWMRAWIGRDKRTLKAMTSRDFRMVFGSAPAIILDATSWLDAADKRCRCASYRFGDVYARRHGSVAIFASLVELEAELDGEDWSGPVWITDVWRKGRVSRRWRLVERIVSRPETRPELPAAMRALQLWR